MFDAIVIGAGPSGSIAAMYIARSGRRVLLVDKDTFPRDKICGDAQGRKAARILKDLDIYDAYEKIEGQKIYGITLSSPNGTQVHLDVEDRGNPAPGYVHKRKIFDNFLFENAKKVAEFQALEVKELIIEDGFVKGIKGVNRKGEEEEHRSNIVLGGDGAHSIVARSFEADKNPPEHFIVALRGYYRNVKGLTDRIELHLIKDLIPGYLWIFPLPNNEANVGLGMIIADMKKKGINLKDALLKQIKENSLFVERFRDAQLADEIRAWNLPIASYHRKCYGNGFLLLGDAASLIDPLSGEGVGNAMISGQIAAKIAIEAIEKGDYTETFLERYDKLLWEAIGDEISTSYKIQRLGKKMPFMIDRLIGKASKNESFRKRVERLLPYTGGRKEIGSKEFLEELASD